MILGQLRMGARQTKNARLASRILKSQLLIPIGKGRSLYMIYNTNLHIILYIYIDLMMNPWIYYQAGNGPSSADAG